MPTFTPTPEQQAIVSAARETTDNLCVIARAGAAKTSTLILIAEALPETKILCLAFNKAIATEMAARLPDNCEAKTLHSLGYAAWNAFIRPRCQIVNGKNYKILKGLIDQLSREEQEETYELFAETLDLMSKAKNAGWLPDNYKGHWKPLMDDAEFFASLPMEPTELQMQLLSNACRISFQRALEGEIDFDDMIFCPAICPVSWPSFPLTLIDEAQDLSPINHHILKKMVKKRRIIAVGDPCQAIYGFRGASADSMQKLERMFEMTVYHLTISFRCAQAITENAQWRAPDMRWPEWAPLGQVRRPISWSLSEIENGDAIICRNNAPIFSIAIKLLEHDKLPRIAGRDIGAPLIKLMKKLGKTQMLSAAAIDAVNQWEEKEIRRARDGAKGGIRDKAEVIRIMLRRTKTLGDAIAYLEHLLARDGRIDLMTGHKSKGLEFDRVWFLDQHLCQIDRDQDANIKYVIETRAKTQLTYISSGALAEADE